MDNKGERRVAHLDALGFPARPIGGAVEDHLPVEVLGGHAPVGVVGEDTRGVQALDDPCETVEQVVCEALLLVPDPVGSAG